jgi:hypothetical protein
MSSTSLARLLLGFLLLGVAGCDRASAEADVPHLGSALLEAESVEPALPPPPPAPRDGAPDIIRGIYLNAYAAGSPARLERLLALADTTEINTFVVDVKTENGIHFTAADHPLAMELALPGHVPIRDLPALVERLRGQGLYTIARIVVFKDPILAKARPQWAIRKPDGSAWVDREGNLWVSAWDENVWEYNLKIAEEAARAGFHEIQFDYVRFPEQYRSLPQQVHPKERGTGRTRSPSFLREARRAAPPAGRGGRGGPLRALDERGEGRGDRAAVGAAGAIADHLLPMVYPSHYFPTHLRGVSRPNRMPYETVYTSVGMGVIRNQRMEEAGARPARIVSWLQAFDAPWVDRNYPYGPEQARRQIDALYDVGLEDWIFWHPGSRYDQIAAAFERETQPRARAFTPPEDMVATVDRFEREGVGAAREAALAAEAAAGASVLGAAPAAAPRPPASP